MPGWIFHATRQQGRVDDFSFEIEGITFKALEFWITPTIDHTAERVHLEICHPSISKFTKMCTYLMLDEALGEIVSNRFLGKITFGDKQLTHSMPLLELPEFVKTLQAENGWKCHGPGEVYVSYKPNEQHEDVPRGDIITGTTLAFPLIREFGGTDGELPDPLADLGADYAYISFDSAALPAGKQAHARGEIEDRLHDALIDDRSGCVLGGAHGIKKAYIDLLLTDGENSRTVIQKTLNEHPLPAPGELHYFAKEKRGHRLVL